ncbi:MAG: hypothetical protein IJ497_07635 [Clostridia bacterium]|nr:hypothetical protein [Clostridia bacterium]
MDYICENKERTGTCYHEFVGGDWDGITFWSDDSLCMHDEIFDDFPEFLALWKKSMPDFDPFGITRMEREAWEMLCALAREEGGVSAGFAEEMRPWMEKAFAEHGFVTILGI